MPRKSPYEFKAPGAISKARWMAKAIYTLKIWMFQVEFNLSAKEEQLFFELSVFIVSTYVKAWFTCSRGVEAPRRDLHFLQILSDRRKKGPLWQAAYDKFVTHLWFLSEKLVCLALFDPDISPDEKAEFVSAMRSREGDDDPPMRARLFPNAPVKNLKLSDFFAKKSGRFLDIIGADKSFLEKHPREWQGDDSFNRAKTIALHLKVVNDSAERGVALIKRYLEGNNLTTDDDERQNLLIVVSEHRKQYKDGKKVEPKNQQQ